MKPSVLFACALYLFVLTSARAEFIGTLEFTPAGCEAIGKCGIKNDFRYKDPKGVEWLTTPPDTTDGATIPRWAQPFIGAPFDKAFIEAAVIHDHYCDRQVRPWRQTHRVLYDALIESGVSTAKAKLMYYAVYLGGPKWATLMPGKPCGSNCVFKVPIQIEGLAQIQTPHELMLSRPAQYDQPGFTQELRAVETLLDQQGDKIDLDALERRAEEKRPDDLYYKSGDTIPIKGGLQFE